MILTFDVIRKDPETKRLKSEVMTFRKSEIVGYAAGAFDIEGKRITEIIVRNAAFPKRTSLQIKMPLKKMRELLEDKYEIVRLT